MQVSAGINGLNALDAMRRAQAPSTTGNSFGAELASVQNLPSSLTGSSGGASAAGPSLSTLLQTQGATGTPPTQAFPPQDRSDPLNQPLKPTLQGGSNPLRSHLPMLSALLGSE